MTADEICFDLELLQASGVELDRLLARTVELLHESSPIFDWTGVYELHPDGMLRLGPYAGAPTDHALIAVGHGVCGSAAAEKRNMNIPDVSKLSNHPARSAATRSELVVLIRDGDRIFAQIDVESHELDAFGHEVVRGVERIAEWLARVYSVRERLCPRGA